MALPAGYRPQLDALRTIAVALVALHHWEDLVIAGYDPQLGFLGVSLFFVLSGYLITGILIGVEGRRRELAASIGRRPVILAFYARRFLRLFPAYYFFLFTMWITGVLTWSNGLAWYLAYAANFRIVLDGWYLPVSHLWTLAVEEQFYLLAPLAVLGLGRTNFVRLAMTTVAVGLVTSPPVALVPPGAFVGLSIGCLLAVAADGNPRMPDHLGRVWPAFFAAAAAVYVSIVGLGNNDQLHFAGFTLLALMAMAGLIWRAANGYQGPVGAVLEWRPLVWLGKISYGLYLWHTFAKEIMVDLGFDYDGTALPLRLAAASVVTVAIAFLSWRIVERPFLDLKDRFPYLPETPAPRIAVKSEP